MFLLTLSIMHVHHNQAYLCRTSYSVLQGAREREKRGEVWWGAYSRGACCGRAKHTSSPTRVLLLDSAWHECWSHMGDKNSRGKKRWTIFTFNLLDYQMIYSKTQNTLPGLDLNLERNILLCSKIHKNKTKYGCLEQAWYIILNFKYFCGRNLEQMSK